MLLEVLVGADLVDTALRQYRLTRAGERVVARRGPEGLRPLYLALLRTGYFHDQARRLLDLGTSNQDGSLTCPTRQARRACPQLIGILLQWIDVTATPIMQIPADLVRELEAVWALLPPTEPGDTLTDTIRKTIGNRGELYSYQFERLAAETASDIVWVARDDETLGYDIEDRSIQPRRRIEVKASGDTTVRFFLSDNEWRKAHENPQHYEIHFWGGIDLAANPAEEFQRLRGLGYPRVFVDLPSLFGSQQLSSIPVKWRISEPS